MTLALPLAAAALVPSGAEACSQDPCYFVDVWQSLEVANAAAIPIDGVLLLQGARSGSSPEEDWLDKVELTVTRDGQPIAGAVEAVGVHGTLAWRPAEPLEPGDYKAVGSLDHPEIDPYYEGCAPDVLTLDFGFKVEAEPSAPLSPPKPIIEEMLWVDASDDLEELVCCDGAMPYSYAFDCGGSGEYVDWDEGFCAATRGFGRLHVELSVATDLPAATDALVRRELLVDGAPRTGRFDDLALREQDSKPFCVAVRLTNIATGDSVVSEETCHGADMTAQLGDHMIDPAPALAEQCAGAAYVCELDGSESMWDPDKCTPWPADETTTTGDDPTGGPTTGDDPTGGPGPGPDSDGSTSTGTGDPEGPASGGQDGLVDHGCACDAGEASPLGALALLGLGLLRPRRRRPSG